MQKENIETKDSSFDLDHSIDHIKHYLPSQWALKDFIHHNTLHAFQDESFFEGLHRAYEIFGYKVTLSVNEYLSEYEKGRISDEVISRVLGKHYSSHIERERWRKKMFEKTQEHEFESRIGSLREHWKTKLGIDMDAMVYPLLFRILCNFLDQGIAIWGIETKDGSFLNALRDMEKNGFVSFFKRDRAKKMFQKEDLTIEDLLEILVGKNKALYETYLFDQQFEHQGWSGFVSEVEANPKMLLDPKKITTKELIFLECLLEIDALDYKKGADSWCALENYIDKMPRPLFTVVSESEVFTISKLWQESYEWSYYFPVLKSILEDKLETKDHSSVSFQTIMCIDDRICSWRRYIEKLEPNCETFSTPGFFGLDMMFQPEGGQFYTKVCPAPMNPQYLVKEVPKGQIYHSLRKKVSAKITKKKVHHHDTDIHFSEHAHNSILGGISSYFIGFISALSLVKAIFFPKRTAATSSPFNHMEKIYPLAIENYDHGEENGLKLGYTKDEMVTRVMNTLKSIGLTKNFAKLVYVIGHGSTSTNNPYYAGYDCGACSGRAGSVNARVFCHMANDKKVRHLLEEQGIVIPDETIFMGGLHDTTQDVVQFYDKDIHLKPEVREAHLQNKKIMREALLYNAKERARRFENIDNAQDLQTIHKNIKKRAVSFFEPRPEYNHATNSLCIVGRRDMTKHIFLDRRAFLNSYDYAQDKDGIYLQQILNAAAPVCGGINLEYYFSRTDNSKLGSGSKLPHNVMGLFGVANGIEGDLRPGLPAQMIEIHEPMRLMIIVEQFPEVILSSIQANSNTHEWFKNEWIHLVCKHPEKEVMYVYKEDIFQEIDLLESKTPRISFEQFLKEIERNANHLPVKIVN